MIVVDSNVIAYCWIRTERTQAAQRVRLCDSAWHAPVLWRSEVRSALAGCIARGLFDTDRAADVMRAAESAMAGCEHLVDSAAVLELAASTGLSACDCEFVVLARALAVPLVTEDRAILKASPDVAMRMEAFLEDFPPVPTAAHESRRQYRTAKRAKPSRLRATL